MQKEMVSFHGTFKENCKSILEDGFRVRPAKDGDNHYLGHGIYWYAYYEHAEMWARKKVAAKKRKGQYFSPAVLKSKIVCDSLKILDLDNPRQMEEFLEHIKIFEKVVFERYIIKSLSQRNDEYIRLCYAIDYYKKVKGYDVVMRTFGTSSIKTECLEYRYEGSINLGLAYNEKQICVSDNCFIHHLVMVFPKEVIV